MFAIDPFVLIFLLLLGFALGMMVMWVVMTDKQVKELADMAIKCLLDGIVQSATRYQKEAIERGYGEMYDCEIDPEKHPGLTVPTFRWIEPNGK